MALLTVENLRTTFRTDDGPVGAVDGVSLSVDAGKVLGIVGESGCGKSAMSLSIMGLLPKSATVEGSIRLGDRELVGLSGRELRTLRGDDMAMIFQDPMTSLNPVMTIGWQLVEAVRLHQKVSKAEARRIAIDGLAAVGIPSPEDRMRSYPMELSGGMRQRVMIAMALLNRPRLLIADEPTTALDVTTQAQILQLMRELRTEVDAAIVLITHDLGVVAELCDEVAVMDAGRVVERATVDELFAHPQHPYTWGLLASLPGRNLASERLHQIPGSPPSLLRPPAGCRFAPRCPFAMDACRADPAPALTATGRGGAAVACHLTQDVRDREGARHSGE
ncbi:MAG: ABC transporter ATP-binding protein, partial [Gaiellales bacterium]